ncbi:MAG: transcription-repair coupling factor [Planctomycetes bacterium]|nr:transcription-repair coupling factor [Planctomycetota bacterium]
MNQTSFPAQLLACVEAVPAFDQLEELLRPGALVTASGLPGGARDLLLAALAKRVPLIVVLPREDDAPQLVDDLANLLDGARDVLRFPNLDLSDADDDDDDDDDAVVNEGSLGARLRITNALGDPDAPPAVVSTATALLQALPAPTRGVLGELELAPGQTFDPEAAAYRLVGVGYRRVSLVEAPGEFAIRGGIVDLYPLGADQPLRVELFGDEVESLRHFDPTSQRSTGVVPRARLSLIDPAHYRALSRDDRACLLDHLPPHGVLVLFKPQRIEEVLEHSAARFADSRLELLEPAAVLTAARRCTRLQLALAPAPDGEPRREAGSEVEFPFVSSAFTAGHSLEAVGNELGRLVAREQRVTVCCFNDAERERLAELLGKSGLEPELTHDLRGPNEPPGLSLVTYSLPGGFRAPPNLWVTAAHRLFRRTRRGELNARVRARLRGEHLPVERFADLEAGTYVVHVSHGIARFQGVVRRDRDGKARDLLQLEFDGSDLFIPTDRIGLIRRYVGPTARPPRLSKLGGRAWKSKTKKAREAVQDLAADLLEVQARRELEGGFAFPPDDRLQDLFEESFPYTDTDDQLTVTAELKRDMERPRAMDRLVCGDVGYGKTEIAIRAAFKCANAGRQVAVLVPTTVLAHQHGKTFAERLEAYPIQAEAISRFLSPAQQKDVLARTASGEVDILIGTHRLLSKDVHFKDLGLVIVDEEQRFGVAHKERLKALRNKVDLLTLTATPIPRTLHMALSGARDISILNTPPPGRSAIETKIVPRRPKLLKRAIERELAREGQVYVVHDRVRTIEQLADDVREWVPTARVLVVHGQMPERQIEERMLAFMEHRADVLVATTLIENGLDIPRANTLLLDRANHYGLSEMHQLRGRVGRSSVKAYCYLVLPKHGEVNDIARRRLRALEEFSDLGAGFQIAMRDLEIRGAGNVLGAEQSGHIANVGYDLYCRLLKRAVAELKGDLGVGTSLSVERDLDPEAAEVEVVLDVEAYVPDAYVDSVPLKIEAYRKLANARGEEELEQLELELVDRYGPLPEVLQNLFALRRLRIRAAGHGVLKISRQDRVLRLKCRERERLAAGVVAHHDRLRPIDEHMLYLVMPDPEGSDEDQLRFLLEVLGPAPESDDLSEAPISVERLRRERRRRQRAREHQRKMRSRKP